MCSAYVCFLEGNNKSRQYLVIYCCLHRITFGVQLWGWHYNVACQFREWTPSWGNDEPTELGERLCPGDMHAGWMCQRLGLHNKLIIFPPSAHNKTHWPHQANLRLVLTAWTDEPLTATITTTLTKTTSVYQRSMHPGTILSLPRNGPRFKADTRETSFIHSPSSELATRIYKVLAIIDIHVQCHHKRIHRLIQSHCWKGEIIVGNNCHWETKSKCWSCQNRNLKKIGELTLLTELLLSYCVHVRCYSKVHAAASKWYF